MFLGGEDHLEKKMVIHSSILAWKIPSTEEPGRLHSPWSCKRVGHDLVTKQQLSISCNLLSTVLKVKKTE